MKLTKRHLINYLVDVRGYSEDDAKKELAIYGIKELLTPKELNECNEFNK